MPETTIQDTLAEAIVDAAVDTFGHATGCEPEPQDYRMMLAALDTARERIAAMVDA